MSPQIVTGVATGWMLDSGSISHASLTREAVRTLHHEFFDDLTKLLHVVFGKVFAVLCCF